MEYTKQDIEKMIRAEIRRNENRSQFSLQNSVLHTHNGLDSKPIFSPTIPYAGHVAYEDTFTGSGQFFLPVGWTATQQSTGSYLITHNLGTLLYSFVASATQSTNEKVFPVVNPFDDAVEVNWFDINGAFTDTSFNFVLVQVNNKKSPLIQYAQKL